LELSHIVSAATLVLSIAVRKLYASRRFDIEIQWFGH